MRVFLLGGTGAIGRYALPALIAAGHEVSALARTSQKAAAVRERGGAPVTVSMFDRGALSAAFRSHGAVPFALQVPSGVYNVVDNEPLTKRQYAQALADAAGKRPWIRGPGRLAAVFGDRLTSLTRSLRVSNRQFRHTSGWEPRYPSAREGWAATAREV